MSKVLPQNGDVTVGHDAELVPPPPEKQTKTGPPPERDVKIGLSLLSEEEARKAIQDFVAGNMCCGSGAIEGLKCQSALLYTLETFTESRYISSKSIPHTGQNVDGLENGKPPDTWDISVEVPSMFQDCSKEVKVPHTEKIKDCGGKGKVVEYLVLNVSWKNNVVDHIVTKETSLPAELIRSAKGQTLLEETQPKVWPLQKFKEEEINTVSANLLKQEQFPKRRILQQRQTVTSIPVTRCTYKWTGITLDIIVYGFEHKIYAPDFPMKSCKGCTII